MTESLNAFDVLYVLCWIENMIDCCIKIKSQTSTQIIHTINFLFKHKENEFWQTKANSKWAIDFQTRSYPRSIGTKISNDCLNGDHNCKKLQFWALQSNHLYLKFEHQIRFLVVLDRLIAQISMLPLQIATQNSSTRY